MGERRGSEEEWKWGEEEGRGADGERIVGRGGKEGGAEMWRGLVGKKH